ncbi:helix-turn-helix transcriptional regulator [Enterobacter kobei]|nr:helix-turn-helix transcriptional regulator [Enterobacter kobei]
MAHMSSLGDKFRLIRKAEGLTRQEFADVVGLPYGTLTNYETKGFQVTEGAFIKVTKNPRFKKYALWLCTDETAPEVGQISPALSLDGLEQTEDAPNSTPNALKSPR